MTTTVRVSLPSGEWKEFSIDKDVFRIGSMAGCDLVIRGIAPHSLTIQNRGGRCMLFSRCSRTVWLADQQVAPFGTAEWPKGQQVRLPEGVVLTVDHQETTQVALARRLSITTDSKPSTDRPTPQRNRNSQMAIICVSLCGMFLLAFDSGPGHSTTQGASAQFDVLVRELLASEASDAQTHSSIAHSLQSARRLELRRDHEAAVQEYGRVRDMLLTGASMDDGHTDELDSKALEFVRERLRQLGSHSRRS